MPLLWRQDAGHRGHPRILRHHRNPRRRPLGQVVHTRHRPPRSSRAARAHRGLTGPRASTNVDDADEGRVAPRDLPQRPELGFLPAEDPHKPPFENLPEELEPGPDRYGVCNLATTFLSVYNPGRRGARRRQRLCQPVPTSPRRGRQRVHPERPVRREPGHRGRVQSGRHARREHWLLRHPGQVSGRLLCGQARLRRRARRAPELPLQCRCDPARRRSDGGARLRLSQR